MNFSEIFNKLEQNKNTSKDDRILIVDSLNSFLRVWASVPQISESGEHVGGIVGFLRSIALNIREFNPSRCILVFDGNGGSARRRKLYPEYKSNRTNKHNIRREGFSTVEEEQISMHNQMIRLHQYLELLPVQIVVVDNIEADDAISFITKHFETQSKKIRIVSTDRDFLQLINDKVEVYSPVKKKLYNINELEEEFKIKHYNYLLHRMVEGDVSDNIPGVKGVGLKSLLKTFPQLNSELMEFEDLLRLSQEEPNPKGIHKKILEHKDELERNYKLMQLTEVQIGFDSKQRILNLINQETNKLNRLQFKRYLIEDRISTFKNVDDWLITSFSGLNSWIH